MRIGIIGSAQDLGYTNKIKNIAYKIGNSISPTDCLLFGLEQDCLSLPMIAAQGAKEAGVVTVGFMANGKAKDTSMATVVVNTGGTIGASREVPLILSCDKVIIIGGGSGTLQETTIAYQNNIPLYAVVGTGGWADKLVNTFLDKRKRIKITPYNP